MIGHREGHRLWRLHRVRHVEFGKVHLHVRAVSLIYCPVHGQITSKSVLGLAHAIVQIGYASLLNVTTEIGAASLILRHLVINVVFASLALFSLNEEVVGRGHLVVLVVLNEGLGLL